MQCARESFPDAAGTYQLGGNGDTGYRYLRSIAFYPPQGLPGIRPSSRIRLNLAAMTSSNAGSFTGRSSGCGAARWTRDLRFVRVHSETPIMIVSARKAVREGRSPALRRR